MTRFYRRFSIVISCLTLLPGSRSTCFAVTGESGNWHSERIRPAGNCGKLCLPDTRTVRVIAASHPSRLACRANRTADLFPTTRAVPLKTQNRQFAGISSHSAAFRVCVRPMSQYAAPTARCPDLRRRCDPHLDRSDRLPLSAKVLETLIDVTSSTPTSAAPSDQRARRRLPDFESADLIDA